MATPKAKSQTSLKYFPSNSSSSQVRVVVRVRPFIPQEIGSKEKNPTPCITVLEPEHKIAEEVTVHLKDQWTSRNECYKLDSFFGQEDCVNQIFHKEVSAVIPGVFQGLNATVFAYGATGSGKTYTMQGTEDEPGVIPLAMSTIFSLCDNVESSVEISYYEVYMDRCYDLLEPRAKEIMALDDKEGRVQLKGLSWVPVHSIPEFLEVLSTGIQRRKVAHTGLNDVSSRSHGVLAIAVTNGAVKGKLNLIDLAGNEDNRRTGNVGIRLQESAKINQSLFALSNVIYALNNNQPRVPYRESKLTRILQDSLGGTSRALMIACLNPVSYQEAVHTVSLAARSRQIINYVDSAHKQETPNVKVDMEVKLRAWLESKGKTKSIQRMNGPCSPFLGKTPTSVSNLKKPGSVQSPVKSKTTDWGVSNTKARKLFDTGASTSATMEENLLPNAPACKDVFMSNKETSRCEAALKPQHDTIRNDCSCFLKGDKCHGHKCALHDKDHLDPSENINCSEVEYFKDQVDAMLDECSCIPRDNSNEYIIENGSDQLDPSKSISFPLCSTGDDKDEHRNTDVNFFKLLDLPDTSLDKENLHTSSTNNVGSPPISEKIRELQNCLRKVLSPIHSNMTPSKHLPSDDRICFILLEPKTPKTPYVLPCDRDKVQMTGTPLDKFNALSSNLKESLVQEYLTFLNIASKEELLQLKGIGQKRAEYILELRNKTPKPLKSLDDLEKIGLSSKQVHDMFRRAARGIFT